MDDGEVGCIVNSRGNLEHLMYDLPTKWCQIVYLQGKELSEMKKIVWSRRNKKMFTFEVINKIIERGGILKCIEDPSVRVIDVDTSKLPNVKGRNQKGFRFYDIDGENFPSVTSVLGIKKKKEL